LQRSGSQLRAVLHREDPTYEQLDVLLGQTVQALNNKQAVKANKLSLHQNLKAELRMANGITVQKSKARLAVLEECE
jgi:hypothetical protein